MGTILKIALRNLTQHKAKTLIIGLLIVVSISLGLVGNTVLDSAQRSLKRTFTENFTGQVLILPKEIQGGVFGSSQGDDNTSGPPILPMMKDYETVAALVKSQPEVASSTSQISSYAIFNFQDDGVNFGLTFGIEPEDYFRAFNNVVVLEGRKLQPGETGLMLNEKMRAVYKKDNGVDLKVGDTIQLNNFGESGFKIREVPIVGVFRFVAGNERSFDFMQPNFVDVNTLRALKGKAVLTTEDLKLDTGTKDSLALASDDFFNETTTVTKSATTTVNFDKLLGDGPKRVDQASTDHGAWNYLLLKLKPEVSEKEFIAKLNALFEAKKLTVKAQDWVPSAQPDSGVFFAMAVVFNIIIWLIAIVSVIIIMNTLVASVMERTPEIGTMRALGAQKGFVRTMFIMETLTITAVFGLVGIVLGFLLISLLNVTGISAPNDFMKLIFGGDNLRPNITWGQVGTSLVIISFIALVSWILPVRMALKVSPLKAINSD